MTGPTPPISPDGAYWWDGQSWRPMPMPAAPAPAPPPAPAAGRPSWLADSAELPGAPAAAPVVTAADAAYSPVAAAAPAWVTPAPGSRSRTSAIIAAGVGLLLIVGAVGAYAISRIGSQTSTNTPTAGTGAAATESSAASPSAAPAAAAPLTGQMGGEYCPVAHPGDAACWKGTLLNTGPTIGKLALMFVTGGGYSDWFANHANGTLSGFYTTSGCEVDAAHSQIICGSLAGGGHVNAYLGGDVTTRGTFQYAVKFADISSGTPVYVNQHSDGTHDVVSWTEVIT